MQVPHYSGTWCLQHPVLQIYIEYVLIKYPDAGIYTGKQFNSIESPSDSEQIESASQPASAQATTECKQMIYNNNGHVLSQSVHQKHQQQQQKDHHCDWQSS